jgi:hypothetical protein
VHTRVHTPSGALALEVPVAQVGGQGAERPLAVDPPARALDHRRAAVARHDLDRPTVQQAGLGERDGQADGLLAGAARRAPDAERRRRPRRAKCCGATTCASARICSCCRQKYVSGTESRSISSDQCRSASAS